jgi:uncharacterized repeat protein (TIGR03803 family)
MAKANVLEFHNWTSRRTIWPFSTQITPTVVEKEISKTEFTSMRRKLAKPQGANGTGETAEPVHGRKPVVALRIRLLCVAVLALPVLGAQAGVILTSLHSFQAFPNGASPQGGLVQGSDGNFYGTTSGENPDSNPGMAFNNFGTVFKITASGVLTTLYSFTGGNDGVNPQAALVQGGDGSFYGTTSGGGTNGLGTVFKISTNGALRTLYVFGSIINASGEALDGAGPNGLVQGSDGYFYGTTAYGGTHGVGYGTVFKISTNGLLTTLYSFTGVDGANPLAGLVQGSDGNFYGTTYGGGKYGLASGGYGTVFKISTSGTLTTLYSFAGGDGANPSAALVQGVDGSFYGTTLDGGTGVGYGTVFKISTNDALTTLYVFGSITNASGEALDGAGPNGLVQGRDGYFYGTTAYGGTNGLWYGGWGALFKISSNGALTTLFSFGSTDGANPHAPLVQGRDGYFYGTTAYGGTNDVWYGGWGTVFKISNSGALTSLYSFSGGDGAAPTGLVQGSDGNFYGTTSGGGNLESVYAGDGYGVLVGMGTVFKISANGALTSLYSFGGIDDGAFPGVGLVQGSDGNFYGTTQVGGANGGDNIGGVYGPGTVFKISTQGALRTIYAFGSITNASGEALDGVAPNGLVQGSDGYLYGTTAYGGTNGVGYGGWGTVFKISTNGLLTTLYSFTGGDGANPYATLVQGGDGSFYGTTLNGGTGVGYGTVFKISTNGALRTLYAFGSITDASGEALDGAGPNGLVQGSDGNFYGTTSGGGTNGLGTVFKISTSGALSSLYSFSGNDGAGPNGLMQGGDGNFYGTTSGGGTNNSGTVFKISTSGALSSLYSFSGNDGAGPNGLVQSGDGNFYGTTHAGGLVGSGTLFKLTIVPEFQPLKLANGTLNLSWPTEVGATYQLQYNSDLSSSNWTNLGSAVTAAGATLSATDSITNAPRRFYRLVLLP